MRSANSHVTVAGLLVNISNDDGWFGETGAPGQHLRMLAMRGDRKRSLGTAPLTRELPPLSIFGRIVQQARRNDARRARHALWGRHRHYLLTHAMAIGLLKCDNRSVGAV